MPGVIGKTMVCSPEGDMSFKNIFYNRGKVPVWTYNVFLDKICVEVGYSPRVSDPRANLMYIGLSSGGFLRCADDQLIAVYEDVPREGAWLNAYDLSVGDKLIDLRYRPKPTTVKAIGDSSQGIVYTLTVPSAHSYFANNILVHNDPKDDLSPKEEEVFSFFRRLTIDHKDWKMFKALLEKRQTLQSLQKVSKSSEPKAKSFIRQLRDLGLVEYEQDNYWHIINFNIKKYEDYIRYLWSLRGGRTNPF